MLLDHGVAALVQERVVDARVPDVVYRCGEDERKLLILAQNLCHAIHLQGGVAAVEDVRGMRASVVDTLVVHALHRQAPPVEYFAVYPARLEQPQVLHRACRDREECVPFRDVPHLEYVQVPVVQLLERKGSAEFPELRLFSPRSRASFFRTGNPGFGFSEPVEVLGCGGLCPRVFRGDPLDWDLDALQEILERLGARHAMHRLEEDPIEVIPDLPPRAIVAVPVHSVAIHSGRCPSGRCPASATKVPRPVSSAWREPRGEITPRGSERTYDYTFPCENTMGAMVVSVPLTSVRHTPFP
mmetsp:Transcript_2520/g.5992  ORF Transcript_2520/g.5992 Transcript_2520/m.5992 type:complete len:299 (+) Transcript_2520:235-1131(+)